MIKHFCDNCDKEIDIDRDMVGRKEIVVELGGKKVCYLVEVNTMTGVNTPYLKDIDNPASCIECFKEAVSKL